MSDLPSWAALIVAVGIPALATVAAWGRTGEKLSRIQETLRRLESKEDERSRDDKALQSRVVRLEQAFDDGMRRILANARAIARNNADIERLKGNKWTHSKIEEEEEGDE